MRERERRKERESEKEREGRGGSERKGRGEGRKLIRQVESIGHLSQTDHIILESVKERKKTLGRAGHKLDILETFKT